MSPQPESITLIRSASDADCPDCVRLMDAMNSTFQSVHAFIIQNRDQRAVNESYLGDLGSLIQAQVVAHRDLCRHQRTHS
jgi:hypothetical protein